MRYLFILLAALGCDDAGGTSTDPVTATDMGVSDSQFVNDSSGNDAASPDASMDASSDANVPSEWPDWRKGLATWQWHELPDTSLYSVQPSVVVSGQPDADGVSIAGGLYGRIDAWNGLAASRARNTLYSAANGGHADYAGNEVYAFELGVDAPTWRILRQPTAANLIRRGNYNDQIYSDYYDDGRPGSTHSYYALHFLDSRGAIVRFGAGSLYGTGNEANLKTEAFVLETNDWVPEGTYPEIIEGSRAGAINQTVCMDFENDDVYIGAADGVRRFNAATATYERLAGWLQAQDSVKGAPCIVDRARQRVVFFQDAYKPPNGGLVFSLTDNTLSEITFAGDFRNENTSWRESYGFMDVDGTYLLKTRSGDEVIRVNPQTFEATAVDVTGGDALPDAANGVQTRFQYFPQLQGYAYLPRHDANVWFLASPPARE
ncbi:MAG: hypothetical protein R3E66_05310 [bacterium]